MGLTYIKLIRSCFAGTVFLAVATGAVHLRGGAHGQTNSEPSPQASSSHVPTRSNPLLNSNSLNKHQKLLLLQTEMAESSYNLVQSDKNRFGLIHAYEKLVPALCMPELFETLHYAGSPKDEVCLEYLARLLEIDTANPVAVCVRMGIDSPECSSASADQSIETFSDYRQRHPTNKRDVEIELDEKGSQDEYRRLEHALQVATNSYVREKQPHRLSAVLSAFEELIRLSCRLTRIEVLKRPDHVAASQPTATGVIGASPYDEILNELGVRTGRTTPKPVSDKKPEATRVRYISSRCAKYTDQIKKYDQQYPVAICSRHGFYTPACINAYRAFRKRPALITSPSSAHDAAKERQEPFSSF